MAEIPVFVINLAVDLQRKEQMSAQLGRIPGIRPSFVNGLDGSGLPESACLYLTQSSSTRLRKGTLGCFLSHVHAWEHVAELTEPFGVILEDDVEVRGLELILRLALPSDAEIVFLNDRMSPLPFANAAPTLEPIWRSLQRLNAAQMGAGGDGYLLTPQGARKLLTACSKDLYFGHVDGRLLRYATSEEDLQQFPEDTWIGYVIRRHHNPRLSPAIGILRGYSISPALVWHRSKQSSRDTRDTDL